MCHLFSCWTPEQVEQVRELAREACMDRPEHLAEVERWLDEQYERMPPWLRPHVTQVAPF